MTCVLVSPSVVINTMTKVNLGRERFITSLQVTLHPREKLRQESEAETEAKTVEGCLLPVCSPWVAQLSFIYSLVQPVQR